MFQTLLIQPIYNGFVFLIGVMPGGDVGFAIIALTILIRVVFYPAFAASIRTQMGMQRIQGDLDAINEKYKEDATERAKQTMDLFAKHKVRPFAGIVALLVQIPVFIALYYAFFKEGLPGIATHLLYPFVHVPEQVHIVFLGFLNLLTPHHIVLSLLVVGLQYAVTHYSLARTTPPKKGDLQKEMAHRMQRQMTLYALPTMMGVLSYTLPGAVGLYFAAGNVFSLGQEWVIRRQMITESR